MRQFEIWRLVKRPGPGRSAIEVVVLQHTMLQDLHSCIVAPLLPKGDLPALGRIRPEIAVGRRRYRIIVDRMSVISRADMAARIGSAEEHADQIKRAIDEVFYGL